MDTIISQDFAQKTVSVCTSNVCFESHPSFSRTFSPSKLGYSIYEYERSRIYLSIYIYINIFMQEPITPHINPSLTPSPHHQQHHSPTHHIHHLAQKPPQPKELVPSLLRRSAAPSPAPLHVLHRDPHRGHLRAEGDAIRRPGAVPRSKAFSPSHGRDLGNGFGMVLAHSKRSFYICLIKRDDGVEFRKCRHTCGGGA